jgi:hypothetical protein
MTCPRCQAENDAGARFCEDCGARLEVACPSCGTPVTPGKKFCRSCGAALTTEPAGRFASRDSYTPKHLAEKILTSRSAMEGERKHVTVLFADLKGSMELLAVLLRQDAEVPRWLQISFNARDISYQPIVLTSHPPKRRLSFALDDTSYITVLILTNVTGTVVPLK